MCVHGCKCVKKSKQILGICSLHLHIRVSERLDYFNAKAKNCRQIRDQVAYLFNMPNVRKYVQPPAKAGEKRDLGQGKTGLPQCYEF